MKLLLAILFSTLLIAGCSSSEKKEIAAEKSLVKDVHSQEDLIEKTRAILDKSPHLSQEQKDQFIDLHSTIVSKVQEKNQEIRALKILLFKEMTDKNYNRKKINLITKEIKSAYNDKLDIMLKSMSKVQKILGVKGKEIYQEKWFHEHYRL